MVTLTEIKEQQITTEYEPSVADKIQRILYRLDHGEELTGGRLYDGSNFCVLGLFADESGLGQWDVFSNSYVVGSDSCRSTLNYAVVEYYHLRNTDGAFFVDSLPEHIKDELRDKLGYTVCLGLMQISGINDDLVDKGINSNKILADIIRSGVLFKEES